MAATPTVLETHPLLRDEPPENEGGLLVQRLSLAVEYPVHFTRDVFSWENLTLVRAIARREPLRRHPLLVVVERAVADTHPCLLDDIARYAQVYRERLALVCAPLVLDGGERSKDSDLAAQLHHAFEQHGLGRDSNVAIVGGGALQDVVGYAAATAHRGLRVVRVPTTVLSQADGFAFVKSAINAFGKKDSFATFAPPFAVIDDFDFLRTLPEQETRAGLAGALGGVLTRDPSFLRFLRANAPALRARDHDAIAEAVRRTAERHLEHLATRGDPLDLCGAPARALGPWVARELEVETNHELRHGEALAIGSALETVYAAARGLLDPEVLEEILSTMEALGLPTHHEGLERVACASDTHDFDREQLLRAIDWLAHRSGGSSATA